MIKQLQKHLPIIIMIALIAFTGCKSKKKAMEASAAAERARIEQEQAEKKLKAEEKARQEEQAAREKAQREEEALRQQRERDGKANAPIATRLTQYFGSISSAGNTTAANNSIKEALALFASPDTPVLIVISSEGGVKDYDRPTTIKDYLNYLKDQKKNINGISEVKTDAAGKITELELFKN